MRVEKAEQSNLAEEAYLVEEATEIEQTSVWVVWGAVLIISIPLSLCCYLLLKYVL